MSTFLSIIEFERNTQGFTGYAVDRMNERLSHLYQPLHPAALRLIKQVVDVSHRAGKWTGICGELAGEPEVAAILLGLGVDELSMSASSILAVKKIICNTPYQKAREIAAAALGLKTAKEVQEYAVEQG
jgi:phosphoenolpyruvate-protein phosphotransferase (PTS system enzyme I)